MCRLYHDSQTANYVTSFVRVAATVIARCVTTAGAAGSSDLTGGAGGALSGSSSANAGDGALIGAGAGALGDYLNDQHRKTNIG